MKAKRLSTRDTQVIQIAYIHLYPCSSKVLMVLCVVVCKCKKKKYF